MPGPALKAHRAVAALRDPAPRVEPSPFSDLVLGVDRRGRVRAAEGSGRIGPAAAFVGREAGDLFAPAELAALDALLRGERGWDHAAHLTLAGGPVDPARPVLARAVPSWDGIVLHLRCARAEADLLADRVRAEEAAADAGRAARVEAARRAGLLSAATDAVAVVHGASGRILDVTEAAARRLGGTAAALTGTSFAGCFEGRRPRPFLDALTVAAVSGRTLGARAGADRVAVAPVLRRAGDDLLLVCTLDGAEAGPDGLAALARDVAEGMVRVDAGGLMGEVNAAFLALVGAVGPSAVRGRPLAGLLARGALDMAALAALDRGALLSTELLDGTGGRVPVAISAAPTGDRGLGLVIRGAPGRDAGARGAERAEAAPTRVGTVPLREIVAEMTDALERRCILEAVALTGNNRAAAAEMLGLSRQSLYVKLRKFGLLGRDD